jgi:hypothetical protein
VEHLEFKVRKVQDQSGSSGKPIRQMDHIRIKWKCRIKEVHQEVQEQVSGSSGMVVMGHLDQVEHLDHLWIRSGVSEGQVVLVVWVIWIKWSLGSAGSSASKW